MCDGCDVILDCDGSHLCDDDVFDDVFDDLMICLIMCLMMRLMHLKTCV